MNSERFSLILCFLVMVNLTSLLSVEAYRFVVGGKDGWTLKPSENYNHWAERMRFQVNDTLSFKYSKGSDSILVVSKDDYDICNTGNPIVKFDDGDSTFKFDKSGPFYFISGNKSNCDQGQKLVIIVLAIRNFPKPAPIAPTPATPTPSDAPTPTPASSSPSPSSSVLTPSPSPSVLTPSPSPSVLAPSPSPSVLTPSPSPSVLTPSPSPSILTPSPSPSVLAPSPSPSVLAPSPSPSVLAPSPSPSVLTPSPSPSVLTPSPSPVVLAPAHSPLSNGPVTSPAPEDSPADLLAPAPAKAASLTVASHSVVLVSFLLVGLGGFVSY